MPSYIPDGYTKEAFISPSLQESNGETFHDGLEFVFRPATRQEIVTLDAAVKIASRNSDVDPSAAWAAESLINNFVASHVQSWSLKAADIHPLAVDVKTIERMHPLLFSKLYGVVRGTRLPDKKPGATEDPKLDADQTKN